MNPDPLVNNHNHLSPQKDDMQCMSLGSKMQGIILFKLVFAPMQIHIFIVQCFIWLQSNTCRVKYALKIGILSPKLWQWCYYYYCYYYGSGKFRDGLDTRLNRSSFRLFKLST